MNESGAGYGWVFYLGDGRANVGAGVSTGTLTRTGRNLKDFFDRFLEEPQIAPWLERSEEHTSELQSRQYLVCRLLLEKKNTRLTSSHSNISDTIFWFNY